MEDPVFCDECNRKYKNSKNLMIHMQKFHSYLFDDKNEEEKKEKETEEKNNSIKNIIDVFDHVELDKDLIKIILEKQLELEEDNKKLNERLLKLENDHIQLKTEYDINKNTKTNIHTNNITNIQNQTNNNNNIIIKLNEEDLLNILPKDDQMKIINYYQDSLSDFLQLDNSSTESTKSITNS